MDFDAFLAAVVAGCVTLAAFLFLPAATEDMPDLMRTGIVYLVALGIFGGLFEFWRRRRRGQR